MGLGGGDCQGQGSTDEVETSKWFDNKGYKILQYQIFEHGQESIPVAYRVGGEKQWIIVYDSDNPDRLSSLIRLRRLFDEKKIIYQEEPSRTETSALIKESARMLEEKARRLSELADMIRTGR